MVIAGADVRIAAQAAEVTAHHQNHLAVRLQAHHAIGDVNAYFLQTVGPANVGGFIKARLQFHHHRHLFAVLRRVYQILDDLGIRRGTVQSHLDRQHLGILAGFQHKALYRGGKGFIGMLEQDRPAVANDVEDVALVVELGMIERVMWRIVQFRAIDADDLEQVAQRHHAIDLEHFVGFIQTELGGQHATVHCVHVLFDFQAHDRRETTLTQFRLDHLQHVIGLILGALGHGIARHPEQFAGIYFHAREQQVEIIGDHVLQRHIQILVADLEETRDTGTDRDLDAR